ncbi:MAG: efflux RND transporter periplasmic adaptor subunit [Planctomycetota bacterium]
MTPDRPTAALAALLLLPFLAACDTGSPAQATGASGKLSGKQSKQASPKGDQTPRQDEDGKDEEEAKPKLVKTRALKPKAVQDRLPCTSHVEALHQVETLSRIQGQVALVLVEEGQEVRKGQVLCRFDDREARLNLDNAKVREQEAENGQETAKLELEEAAKSRQQAERDLAQAERDLARDRRGVEQRLTSKEVLEASQLNRDQAENKLTLARFAEKKARLGQEKARTALASARIERRLRERTLEYYTPTAPIDGIVSRIDVRGGEWIGPQGRLCQVIDHKNLILNLDRPQKELARLRVGQEVEVEVDAFPGKSFRARIDLISPVVSRETGTFKARARLLDADDGLRPGMFCRAEIILRVSQEALMIPKVAILYEGDKPFAFVARDGKARRIPIRPGIETKEEVEATIPQGLPDGTLFRSGDSIIVIGQKDLEDGQRIKLAGDEPAAKEKMSGKNGGKPASKGGQ